MGLRSTAPPPLALRTASEGDLVAEYDDFISGTWALVTAGLKLSDFPNRQWDTATSAELNEALEEPTAMRHVEHSGAVLYVLPENFLPLTLAFEARDGARGLFQVTEIVHEPRSVKVRYKLLDKPAANKQPADPEDANRDHRRAAQAARLPAVHISHRDHPGGCERLHERRSGGGVGRINHPGARRRTDDRRNRLRRRQRGRTARRSTRRCCWTVMPRAGWSSGWRGDA
jgi:hypothetical protein